MFFSLFKNLIRKPTRSERRAARGRQRSSESRSKPYLESLETRIVPATVPVYWSSTSSGNWDTASNWSTGQVPGANDDVYIKQSGVTVTHSLATDSDSVNSITSQDPLVLSGGSLSVANASTLTSLTLSGGTLKGAGDVTVSGPMIWSGGTMSGTGTTVIDGSMSIGGTTLGEETLTGRTLDNYGTASWTGADNIILIDGATWNNEAGSVLDSEGSEQSLSNDSEAASTFNNAGLFETTTGTSTTGVGVAFNNSGSVKVDAGALSLAAGGTQTGSFTVGSGTTLGFGGEDSAYTLSGPASVSGTGTVEFEGLGSATFSAGTIYDISGITMVGSSTAGFNGGTVVFNAGSIVRSVGALTISSNSVNFSTGAPVTAEALTETDGTLTGSDALTVAGQTTWSGGTMSGTGTTVIDGSMTITSTSDNLISLSGRTLDNYGTANWTDGEVNAIYFSDGAIWNNEAGSVLDSEGAAQELVNYGGAVPTFNNAGLFETTTGATTTIVDVSFYNSGTIQVASGTTISLSPSFPGFSNNTLSGGTYIVAGVLRFPIASPNTGIVTNAANIILDGSSAEIENSNTSADALAGFLAANNGSLTLEGGKQLTTPVALVNQGSVTIDATAGSSLLRVGGAYTQAGSASSTTLINGGTLTASSAVNLQGGTLQGTGTVNGNVTNSGTVSPGTPTTLGTISINGTYTQTVSGVLHEELAGTGIPGIAYDLIVTTGSASLAGTLDLSSINGFLPTIGSQFQIFDFASSTGDFTAKTGFYLGGGLDFTEQFNLTNLTVIVGRAKLYFLTEPTNTVAGKNIGAPTGVEVELLDSNGNVIAGDETDQITLTSNMNSLNGGGPATVVNGVATFTDLTITTAATGYQLTASATGFGDIVSNLFSITPDVTAQLVFTTEPTGARVGDTLSNVVVTEEDQYDNIETSDNSSSVSLALAPNAGALQGTIPQTVTAGVATFRDLSVSRAGSDYVLTAATGNISKASDPFSITPLDTATVAANASGTPGEDVTLQATVSAVNSSFPVNEGDVTFSVFKGTTQIGSSVVSGTVVAGAANAIFAIPANTLSGSYTIVAAYAPGQDFQGSASTGATNGALTVNAPLPTVQSIVINGGAVQRSMVTSLTITFNEQVTLSNGAVVVDKQGGNAEGLILSQSLVNGDTVVNVTFTGSDIIGGSLSDGNYTLIVDAADVHNSTGQAMAANASDSFWRLFGDARGTGFVDALDYEMFLTAEKTQTMLSIFDYYGTGTLGMTDLSQFLLRFGKSA